MGAALSSVPDFSTANGSTGGGIVGDLLLSDLEVPLRDAETRLTRPVSAAVMDLKEFARRKKAKDHFLRTVLAGTKIFLIGGAAQLKMSDASRARQTRQSRPAQGRAGRVRGGEELARPPCAGTVVLRRAALAVVAGTTGSACRWCAPRPSCTRGPVSPSTGGRRRESALEPCALR